ncbi:hypothetical protein Hs30E_07900 [Lactococcus hodotermopsidis]|uniref:Uncharacterized protein n=1 Tax=Pseudolactococcus hodotermopsidis TaxID=2709157 RepID=A0A6A0BA06_9LACT|nr:hypothetical protein [Lactococcus hodotermopsidis]GFH42239.1 hypothetical protein Hs30E_07900 [Lactococcus hodotermopsidis]
MEGGEKFQRKNDFVINGANLALISVSKPYNPLISCYRDMQISKLKMRVATGQQTAWNYLGNSIIDPLLVNNPKVTSIEFEESQAFLETTLGFGYAQEAYKNIYFNNSFDVRQVLRKNALGILFLHNSWTSQKYREMNKEEFLKTDTTLANIFRFLLDEKMTAETVLQIKEEQVEKRYLPSKLPKFDVNENVKLDFSQK